MKMKALGITVVVILGIFFGLMFNTADQNAALTRRLVLRQGEFADLLRSAVNDMQSAEKRMADLEKKVDAIMGVTDRIAAVMPPDRPVQAPPRQQEDFQRVFDIPAGAAPVKGKADAPVMIVGFLDVQCPFSKRFQPVIDQVLEAYPGKVRYIVKNFPLAFHKEAVPAAKALLAANEQGKYWEMLAAVLENSNQLSAAKYEEIAKAVGLNLKKFKKDLQDYDAAWEKQIQDDMNLGMQVDVRGTPTYFVNGQKTMSRSFEAFKKQIDVILKEK